MSEFQGEKTEQATPRKLEEALKNASFALRLAPNDPGYLSLKGKFLLGLLRVTEARDAFQTARQHGANTTQVGRDLELCERLLARRAADGTFPPEALMELYRALVLNDRPGEALVISARVREHREAMLNFWKQRLDKAGIPISFLNQDAEGNFELKITPRDVGDLRDLSPLAGMPLTWLWLGSSLVTNLTPLRGMQLHYLVLGNCPASDLRPLTGMPLTFFHAYGPNVADLAPLRGMKLTELSLAGTAVTDLTALEGMPLRGLDIGGTKIRDLNPVLGAPIRSLILVRTPFTNYEQLIRWPLTYLDLSQTRITNLKPLAQLALDQLFCSDTEVSDLSALRDMPLRRVGFANTPVRDIGVLRGKKLDHVTMTGCAHLRDVSALRDCVELDTLNLPPFVEDIEFLRSLPNLKHVGFRNQQLSPADFWREYDARKSANRTP